MSIIFKRFQQLWTVGIKAHQSRNVLDAKHHLAKHRAIVSELETAIIALQNLIWLASHDIVEETPKDARERVRKARMAVLDVLENAIFPLGPAQLMEQTELRHYIGGSCVQGAIWSLVETGKIEFTSERKLQITGRDFND